MPHRHPILSATDACNSIRDSKLVAIRWDLVDWGLVLDVDVPIRNPEETPDDVTPVRRMWLVFGGMSEITWDLGNARLPDGCWMTSYGSIVQEEGDMQVFEITTMVPTFKGNEMAKDVRQTGRLAIRSMSMFAVRSKDHDLPGQFGLTREQRTSLADDESMRDVARKHLASL
jgi:hypothetical protein